MTRNRHFRSRNDAGFSMIELAIVVATIALLAGILIPVIGGELEKAKVARARSDMREVAGAFNRYRTDVGAWPNDPIGTITTTSGNLVGYPCLFTNLANVKAWNGPYLNAGVRSGSSTLIASSGSSGVTGMSDPWGRAYQIYTFVKGYNGSQGAIILMCFGPDGVANTTQAQVESGDVQGDDDLFVVTRKL